MEWIRINKKDNVAVAITDIEKNQLIKKGHKFALRDIAKGEILTADNIRLVRPAYGLHPRYYDDVLGKKAIRNLEEGEPLNEQDYE